METGTVSMWVSPAWGELTITSAFKYPISMGNSQLAFTMHKSGSLQRICFFYAGIALVKDGAALWDAGDWLHLVGTWDNSGAALDAHFYINGTLEDSDTTSTPTTPTATDIYVGSQSNTAFNEQFFEGIVRNFKIWDTQFDADQVSTLNSQESI